MANYSLFTILTNLYLGLLRLEVPLHTGGCISIKLYSDNPVIDLLEVGYLPSSVMGKRRAPSHTCRLFKSIHDVVDLCCKVVNMLTIM